jgi:uncharacterized RDD family membrane protein YckC
MAQTAGPDVSNGDREFFLDPDVQGMNAAVLGLSYVVETPENVVLTYQLAGPSVRLMAYIFDLIVRMVFMYVFSICVIIPLTMAFAGGSLGVLLIFMFVLEWLYFGLSEGLFRGKTIGKHFMGLRVIHEGGYPITFWGAILRNLVRTADSLPCYGIGFITMFLSGKFRRLGDLAAQTLVVQERRVSVPQGPVILEKIRPLERNEISGYVPSVKTMVLIEQFLGRRDVLTYARGHEMASVLARTLATKMRYQGDRALVDRYPMAFLARVYATFHRQRMEIDAFDSTRLAPTRVAPAAGVRSAGSAR